MESLLKFSLRPSEPPFFLLFSQDQLIPQMSSAKAQAASLEAILFDLESSSRESRLNQPQQQQPVAPWLPEAPSVSPAAPARPARGTEAKRLRRRSSQGPVRAGAARRRLPQQARFWLLACPDEGLQLPASPPREALGDGCRPSPEQGGGWWPRPPGVAQAGRELVDRKDYYGKTPLYWAAYKGQRRSVELLLEHGANVNTCCKHGGTPLHAAIGLFPDCTLLLIQHGADVNLQDNWGVTPMYLAACSGQTECIRLLVQAGAYISYRNKRTGAPPKRLVSQPALISWLESCRQQPCSLKHLSRLSIRMALGHRRLQAIRDFDLPPALKQYLMFEDLTLPDKL
ncbi:ankyrin repeat and SOCS box protein 8-like [Eublepharis macularius]|uniref:Ankyrin repeat and SOCS box protein 8-like n=1 Tax=Eublepharis macularius TaxID=481883 RepID=A0AA97J7A9_EUBMA|nr:ankyrin repeat and SOCS box protein 8-like [Eublepharis macularius]